MAPGSIRSYEHDQVRKLEVLVAPRHEIAAECPLVAGNGRRHAQPGVGVDVRTADEALHQLVCNVVVLRKKLAGNIERNGFRPVLMDYSCEARCDVSQRRIPTHVCTAYLRV